MHQYEEKIVATVDRIVYHNQDNGYHVLNVEVKGGTGKHETVTINQLKIHEHTTMEFTGQWVMNPKFGKQFKATKSVELPPENKDAMVKYLSSSFFKGIGPVISRKIVDYFKEETYNILKTDIERLSEVPGVSKKKMEAIKRSWEINSEINEIMVFLQSYGISTLFATRVYEIYGHGCINVLRENPYRLAYDIKGIGFKYADKIALDMGFAKDSEERISAGIFHILLGEENSEGHCYLLYHQIIEKANEILGARVQDRVREILKKLIEENVIKLSNLSGEQRFYSPQTFYDERYVAHKIDVLKNNTEGFLIDDSIVQEWEEDLQNEDITLSEEQVNIIKQIVYSGVSVITGQPGTGKTTILRYFIKLLYKLKFSVALCSPTGKAARVMEAATGHAASTIHRLLEVDFTNEEGGFVHNENNQLSHDVFIVDESSMIDINLAASLLKAIPQDAHIVFVGDVDQLPSVGKGLFFSDLIKSGVVDVFRLTQIYRQGKGSEIIEFAHQINNGIEPYIDSPLINPEIWNKVDCMFIDSELGDGRKSYVDYPDWSSLYYGIDILGMIKKMHTESIKKYYGDDIEIQVLMPTNVGFGTNVVNKYLQEELNPASTDKPEIVIGDNKVFRKFDKIIQVQNNYDLSGNAVMNGEVGKIIEVNPTDKELLIEFEDGKKVLYKRNNLLEIKLAYALSIHKAQGSQIDAVLLVLNSNSPFLHRQLVYTGLTRAKKFCCILGSRNALSMAIRNLKPVFRQTSLVELLKLKSKPI